MPTFDWIRTLPEDLRYAARTLRKNPGFTIAVVITMALATGLNTAFFTLLSLPFRPLPVKDPEALLELYLGERASYPKYVSIRDNTKVFSGLTASAGPMALVLEPGPGTDEPQSVNGEFVSENFFSLLGMNMALGRGFSLEESSVPGKGALVILSHDLWHTRFADNPAILGETMELNGAGFTIVGVTSRDFVGYGVERMRGTDLWLPLSARDDVLPQLREGTSWTGDHRQNWLTVRGRIRAGRTLEEAQAEIATLAGWFDLDNEGLRTPPPVRVARLSVVGPMPDSGFGAAGILIVAVTAVTLLMGCSNIANLMLARAAARQSEIGLRLCLGATRGRMIRQLLIEALLLAGLGGVGGVLLSWWSLGAFLATSVISPLLQPAALRIILLNLAPDARVLTYALVISVSTGVVFGLAPAILATRGQLIFVIRDEGASFGHAITRTRLPALLLVAQVSVCLVLLLAAGLLLRGLDRLQEIEGGFDAGKVLVVSCDLRSESPGVRRTFQFHDDLASRLAALPGVQSTSRAKTYPYSEHGGYGSYVTVPGGARALCIIDAVAPNYFDTLGIPILRGRDFTPEETRSGTGVAVIAESTARNLWPHQEAIGLSLPLEVERSTGWLTVSYTVVGVVPDVPNLRGEIDPYVFYLPLSPQDEIYSRVVSFVRTSGDAKSMQPAVRTVARSLSPKALISIEKLSDVVANSTGVKLARATLLISGALGSLVLLLTAIGLYGVLSYSVGRRTREIGVRMALGAKRSAVQWLILRQGLFLIGFGLIFGVAATAAVSRVFSHLLVGVGHFDLVAYLGVALLLVVISLLAMYIPARRAAGVDPMVALRYE
jgi:predicted permease